MRTRAALLSAFVLTGAAFATTLQEGAPPAVEPGPEHEVLQRMAGSWTGEMEMMGMKSTGTYERELGLSGLWLISEYEGTSMAGPFVGHEVTGWDSDKGKYVSCWVDSTSTSMSVMEGSWDAESKALTMSGPTVDPTGQAGTMFSVTRIPQEDQMIFEMYMGSTEGEPMMTITYTRKE